ncbi:MAG: Global regulator protein family [Planctomycetaceae bacterium]|nr:Global regulator protein family [Planctomycetaceae bacterium]
MRVYTRGENQSLVIGRDIVVTVLQVFPDHVRVGIATPQSEPQYWEADLFLPEDTNLEDVELELSLN